MKKLRSIFRRNQKTFLDHEDSVGEIPDRKADSRVVRFGAIALSLLFVLFLVVSVSRAAFVATTENTTNSVSTGTVVLSDNDSGSALFSNVTGLAPGSSLNRCIKVSYTGSLNPTAVKLYISGAPTGTLAQYLDMTVDIGTGDALDCSDFASSSNLYTGTLGTFASTYTSYTNGLLGWDPAGTGESKTFKFNLSVQDQSAAAGSTAGFGFTWETRSS